MNTVNINFTQVMGTVLGLLVIVAGIIVNMKKFGSDIPLTNMVLFVSLGVILALSIFVMSRD